MLTPMTAVNRYYPGVPARLLSLGLLWLAAVQTPGQVAGVHQLNGIYQLPDHTTSLDFGGSVSTAFKSYFDLYML
jgi:hypothetical protein